MGISVGFDVEEPRVQVDRLAVLVTGGIRDRIQWDMANSTGMWLDLTTYTTMLLPYQVRPEWGQGSTYPYNRLMKGDYALTDAKWKEHNYRFDGDTYLYGVGDEGGAVTHASYSRNRGWFFSYFAFGQNDTFPSLQVMIGTVGLSFYSDGSVYVYKPVAEFADFVDENLDGSGSITSYKNKYYQPPQGNRSDNLSGAPVDVLIVPWRKRELLIVSNRGGGFSHVFRDISLSDSDPTIIAAGPMGWYVPTAQPMVQAAPLTFPTSGQLRSFVRYFREPPKTGTSPDCVAYYDLPGYGVEPTCVASLTDELGTPFIPDDAAQTCTLTVDVTGDGTNTPFIYGASAVFDRVVVNTDGEHTTHFESDTLELSLNVPEQPSGVVLTIEVRGTDADSLTLNNRPVEVDLDSVPIFFGRSGPPKFTDSPNPDMQKIRWEVRDPWVALENYQIVDPLPFDTVNLADQIEDLATMTGYDNSQMDVEDFDFTIPSLGANSKGDWAVIPEPGDKAAKWIEKLWEDYAQNCIVGFYPSASGLFFRFRSEATLSQTPSVMVYSTIDEAYDAYIGDGYTAAQAWVLAYKGVYRSFIQDSLAIEANDIRVTGWDSRLDQAFQIHDQDLTSKDPTLVPGSRPDNWWGEPLRYSLFDPAIVDMSTLDYVAGILRSRLMYQTYVGELKCNFLVKADGSPVWKGDAIGIAGYGIYRVTSFNAEFRSNRSVTIDSLGIQIPWYPATYVVRYIGPLPA